MITHRYLVQGRTIYYNIFQFTYDCGFLFGNHRTFLRRAAVPFLVEAIIFCQEVLGFTDFFQTFLDQLPNQFILELSIIISVYVIELLFFLVPCFIKSQQNVAFCEDFLAILLDHFSFKPF